MSNLVSALNGVSYVGFASVEETGLRGMITVRGDLASKAMVSAIAAVTGAEMPDMRRIAHGADGSVAWMSPDEVLVVCAYDAVNGVVATLSEKLANDHALVVNVSDARACFRVAGEGAREVIAKLAPVDMAPDVFQPTHFRRTRFAQVAAAFWANDDGSFEVICFRSVARYMFDILSLSTETGGEVGYFS